MSVPLEIDTALRWGLLQDSWLDQADALTVHLQITSVPASTELETPEIAQISSQSRVTKPVS
jgi:hypothetical protein